MLFPFENFISQTHLMQMRKIKRISKEQKQQGSLDRTWSIKAYCSINIPSEKDAFPVNSIGNIHIRQSIDQRSNINLLNRTKIDTIIFPMIKLCQILLLLKYSTFLRQFFMLMAQLWISSCMLLSNFYYVMNKIVKLNEILFLEKIGISKRLASLSLCPTASPYLEKHISIQVK